MELTGIWKPYGRYTNKDQKIMIQGQELTFWEGVFRPNPKQVSVHFHLEEEHCLRENHCYHIMIDEEQYKNNDFVVHEEIIDGKAVVILSSMGMEYDGRGRIVFMSYVREEDYALVNDDFKSVAYQYWNERPSVPMMQMNLGGNISMGMMGMMEMMNGMMAEAPSSVVQVDPWNCSCGNKQISSRFCPECGLPMPKQ